MLRGMVFVDHMNFDIALQKYYAGLGKPTPKLDYNVFLRKLTACVPNVDFIKAFVFCPKPDEFLMQDSKLSGYYNWVAGLKNAPYIDVVEGSYVARAVTEGSKMDISDKSTYYKVEKGTDINIAIHAVNKAFYNSYDIGFFVSADTDFAPVYETLKNLGKLAVISIVKGQRIYKLKPVIDSFVVLDETFFSNCTRITT